MTNQSASASKPANRETVGLLGSWPAMLVVLIVLVSGVFAFSHRPIPPFPATRIAPDSLLITGLARDAGRLIAVGEQGHILIADKTEGPWREATVQPERGSTFTQVRVIGEGVVIAVGHDGWIVRSEDRGETWKEVAFTEAPPPAPDPFSSDEPPSEEALNAPLPLQPDPLLGIAGPYDGKLFAFGGFGQMQISNNLGKSWQRVQDQTIGDRHLNAMTQAKDGSLLLVGERGLMLRSTDKGQSWKALPQVYAGSFFGLLTLKSGALLGYGMRGNIFVSRDNGSSWRKVEAPVTSSLFGGAVTEEGHVLLVGEGSVALVSKDDAATFQLLPRGEAATGVGRSGLATVLPIENGEWITGGEAGILRHRQASADGAKS